LHIIALLAEFVNPLNRRSSINNPTCFCAICTNTRPLGILCPQIPVPFVLSSQKPLRKNAFCGILFLKTPPTSPERTDTS
jgi:hypothetical protein